LDWSRPSPSSPILPVWGSVQSDLPVGPDRTEPYPRPGPSGLVESLRFLMLFLCTCSSGSSSHLLVWLFIFSPLPTCIGLNRRLVVVPLVLFFLRLSTVFSALAHSLSPPTLLCRNQLLQPPPCGLWLLLYGVRCPVSSVLNLSIDLNSLTLAKSN
jgi:hypothetical protein